jgi:predicted ArsR family transcriptional regulator
LGNLKNAQLIRYEEVQNGVGRPSYVYSLTERAQRIFPRNYQELAGDMLDTIKDLYGKKAVEAIFTKRTNKKIQNYRLLVNASSLSERIKQLVSLRRIDGYMSTWEETEDHSFIVNELNCPIQHVAEGCETACKEDLRIFSDLLDAQVTRVSHMVQGDNACCYKIIPK